jgi:hypothetical protein
MQLEYYKIELNHLDKAHWNEVTEWLERASLDSEISINDMNELNNQADTIFYER